MLSIQRLVLLLTLGLALGLAGCGGDDDDGDGNPDGNGNGGCEGSDADLLGSCVESDTACWEARGDYFGEDVGAGCEEDGGTWSAGTICAASYKTSGACVVNVSGAVAVGWDSSSSPSDWEMACGFSGFGCYIAP